MLIFKIRIYRDRPMKKLYLNKSLKLKGKKLKSKNYQNILPPPKKNVHRKEFLIT